MSLQPVPVDLETTGLHPVDDAILEFAMLVCDRDLEVVADFGTRVVRQPRYVLDQRMSDYVREMHIVSGLYEEVLASERTLQSVDEEAAEFLRDLGFHESPDARDRDLILLGSSCRLDLGMVELQMPQVSRFLHYRMIDCSGIREAVSMWAPELMGLSSYAPSTLSEEPAHRAHADARRTLEEAREQRSALQNARTPF